MANYMSGLTAPEARKPKETPASAEKGPDLIDRATNALGNLFGSKVINFDAQGKRIP
jgi:hypothetical protein